MAVSVIDIETFVQWRATCLVLDVRSPAEFEHAHIPGAVSLPLFDNEERKVVGTIYKQQSRQLAIKAGLRIFGPKMVKLVERVEQLVEDKRAATGNSKETPIPNDAILLHCWRGGMRSAGVAWLLDLYGFKVFTLRGGYKAFRQWAHQVFLHPYNLKIVGGYTGSGKTGIIHQLKKAGKNVLDLEGLTSHKGSAFGSINMPAQPSQEMFENVLALQLHRLTKTTQSQHPENHGPDLWLEDESQRIGDLRIPAGFWAQMRSAPVFFIDIPFEQRLAYLVQDYGKGDQDKLVSAIMRIQKKLGGLETKNAINFLLEDNTKESFRILLNYYDKAYLKGLNTRPATVNKIVTVSCPTVTNANANALLNTAQLV